MHVAIISELSACQKKTILFNMILQADYYETSTWLTEEEKKELDRKEQSRLEKYKVERIIEYLEIRDSEKLSCLETTR